MGGFLTARIVTSLPPSLADGETMSDLQVTIPNECAIKPGPEDVKSAKVKPDKMEETLTCIICQELLHDCVRYGCPCPWLPQVWRGMAAPVQA